MDHFPARIAIIDDAHTFGGAQIALAHAINAITAVAGREVVLVCPDETYQCLLPYLKGTSSHIHVSIKAASPLNILGWLFRYGQAKRIVDQLLSQGIEKFILNLSGIEFCIAPMLALQRKGVAVPGWLHNPERHAWLRREDHWLKRWLLHRTRDAVAEALVFPRYGVLAVPSRGAAAILRNRLSDHSHSSVEVLYPTVSIPLKDVQPYHSPPAGVISMAVIGRIEFGHKNQMAALELARYLGQRGRMVAVHFVGDGPDRAMLESAIASLDNGIRCVIHGWRSNPWAVIPRDASVVIPSFFEGMPLVAIEAMLRVRPLIVSPLDIFREGVPSVCISSSFRPEDFAAVVESMSGMKQDELARLYDSFIQKFDAAAFCSSLCGMM